MKKHISRGTLTHRFWCRIDASLASYGDTIEELLQLLSDEQLEQFVNERVSEDRADEND